MHRNYADVLPLAMLTESALGDSFRMLSRAAASVHHYSCRRHEAYPYRLFGLLHAVDQSEDAAKAFAHKVFADFHQRKCCLCAFTLWFLETYPDEEALLSAQAIQELRAVAVQTSTDIAATECAHAANRRSIKAKSLQTHSTPVRDASALFVSRSLRNTCAFGFEGLGAQIPGVLVKRPKTGPETDSALGLSLSPHCHPALRTRGRRSSGPLKKQKKTQSSHYLKHRAKNKPLVRGGGAWAVFLSENPALPPTTEQGKHERKALSKKYKNLDETQLERLGKLATTATQVQRFGGKRVVSKMRRTSMTGFRHHARRWFGSSKAIGDQPPLPALPLADDQMGSSATASSSSSASSALQVQPQTQDGDHLEVLIKTERLNQAQLSLGPWV